MGKKKSTPRGKASAPVSSGTSPSSDLKKTKTQLTEELQGLRHELQEAPAGGQCALSVLEYQSVIKRAHDAFWVTNTRGEIVDTNEAALRMLGYSRQEFIGMHVSRVDAAETPEETEAHIRRIMETGSDSFETLHRTRDGRVLDVEVSTNYYEDEKTGGKFFAFVRDISKRKRIEADLIKKTHDFSERAKELQCLYTVSKLITNPGAGLEEILQGTVDIIPPAWQYPQITSARVTVDDMTYTSSAFEESPWRQSSDIIADGARRGRIDVYYLEEREHSHEGPFLKEERDLINGLAEMLGIALRNRSAEARLREREKESRSIIDSSPVGITLYDSTGQCVSANESMGRIIGATKEQVLAQNFHHIGSWKNSGLYAKATATIEDGEPRQHAAILKTTFGKKTYLDCYFVSFGDKGLLFMAHDITARMATEEKYKAVVNLSNDALMIVGADGRLVEVNDATSRVLGYGREELMGLHISNIDVDESPESVRERMETIQREGSMRFESRQRRKDGSIIDVEVSAGIMPGDDGQGATFGFVRDITRRKLAESRIKKSEEGLKQAQRIASMGSWTWEIDGNMISWSDETYRVFGLSREMEISYDTFLGTVHPEDREMVNRAVTEALEGKGTYALDHRIVRPDGAERIVHEQAEVAYDSAGKPASMAGTVQDITQRRRAELELQKYRERLEEMVEERSRALMESQNRFGMAVSGAPIIFFTLDTHGTIMLSEGKGLEGLGFSSGELVGKSAFLVYKDFPEIVSDIRQCLGGEELRRTVNLHGLWLETLLSPLRDSNGEVIGVVGVSTDITSRKLAEERTALYQEELNNRNAELSRALESAKAADRLKDEFMANISHELRTPMSGVIGITELLLDTDLTEDQREQLRLISSSADSLLIIINDLLDFSKIEAGRLKMHEERFSLRELFGDTVNFFVVSAGEKGIALLFDVKADVPDTLVGDHVRLRQVLVNLIGNAVKFTEEGSICVKVTLEGMMGDRALIRFCVNDTGVGIPQEHVEKIFDAFSQADGTVTRRHGGTGLGLSISSRLVRLMGGELEVESTPGEGSSFHFSIPLGLKGGDYPGRGTGAELLVTGSEVSAKPLSILLAEDNMINQKLAVRIVEKAGHRVTVAGNGREALEMLDKNRFDIVLMDVMMPVMDGIEATRAIRARESGTEEHIPIIAMTAHAMSGHREKFLEAGMDEYLSKPLKAKDLIGLINKLSQ